MKQALPIGIDDFREIRSNGYYYIDKTEMIKEFIDNRDKVALITRPRRFGKTLIMTMLRDFFDLTRDSRSIFEGLAIMETPCLEQMNSQPVVYFTMKNCNGATLEELLYQLSDTLFLEYGKYAELFEGKVEREDYRYLGFYQNLEHFKRGTHTFTTISLAVTHLMRAIHAFYRKGVILLIDEYDQPILSSYENGYKKELGDFFAGFYGSALKGNPDLSQALLTGIQRVAKESIFSKLNNVQVYTVLDPFYSPYFGLTAQETEKLLKDYGYELDDGVRMMYDGYRFGNIEMYNPWSLLCYVKRGILKNYWVNTSTNFLVKEALKNMGQGPRGKFDVLMLQGTVDVEATLETSFIELQDSRSLWGLLVNSGYLTVEAVLNPRQSRLRVRIPNGEVREEFSRIVESMAHVPENSLSDMMEYLTEGNIEAFLSTYREIVLSCTSYFDALENAYHMLMLGMCVSLRGLYEVKSNLETGNGRSDILLRALSPERMHVILEFKQGPDVNALSREGLTQMLGKKYFAGLTGRVLCVGIAHNKKECEAVYQILEQ